MPSLHAADALIVGITLFYVVRTWWLKALWLLWPAWVCFSVMATANHFWLDCVAGGFVALLAGADHPPPPAGGAGRAPVGDRACLASHTSRSCTSTAAAGWPRES